MEAGAKTVMRCVALLSMLVLSLATAASPQGSVPAGKSILFCAKECAITCIRSIFDPPAYAACCGLCMTACKIIKPTSDIVYGCTRNCVNSMSKVLTTTAKPSISGTCIFT